MSLGRYSIQADDNIHHIARRVLGSADQWWVLVRFNRLDYPYIDTTGATYPGKTVLGLGATLLIPGTVNDTVTRRASIPGSPEQYRLLLGTDVALSDDGDLVGKTGRGDWQTDEGIQNLICALTHRLLTRKGELAYHPEYGSDLEQHIGKVNEVSRQAAIVQEIRTTLLADPRIARITRLDVEDTLDNVDVKVTAQLIGSNDEVPLNLILNNKVA